MAFFNIFLDVIEKEQEKFNVDKTLFGSYVCALKSTLTENFDFGYNRCAYMYRYATCYTYFFKDCITKFLSECPEAIDLLSSWRSHSDLSLCSLSCGPGLDYLSFNLAVLELKETPNIFNSIKIISKHGAWRNTVNFLTESIAKVRYQCSTVAKDINFKNIKVTQGNIFEVFTEKTIDILQKSEVVLMFKTLNMTDFGSNDEEASFISSLILLVSSLRPETTVFFIDTKPSLAVMQKVLSQSCGTYLYGPIHSTFKLPNTFPDELKEKISVLPAMSSRGAFFVWQKSPFHSRPNSPVTPECIRSMMLMKENDDASSETTKFSLRLSESDGSLSKEVNNFDSALSFKNPVLSSNPWKSRSANNSPSFSQCSGTKIDSRSPIADEGNSFPSPQSKLSNSVASNPSDPFDHLLTEILNFSSSVTPKGREALEKAREKTESSKDTERDSTYQAFPSLNIPASSAVVDDNPHVSDQTLQNCLMSSKSKSSNKQEEIQNVTDGRHTNDLPSIKPEFIQTDPVVDAVSRNSIRLLTDKINQLACSFEKELTRQNEPCKNHCACVSRCHSCSFCNLQVHHCASHSHNCDNARAKSLACFDCKNKTGFGNVDSTDSEQQPKENTISECSASAVGCGHSCSVKHCCSQPIHAQCCLRQHIPPCLSSCGSLFANSPISATLPSIVIPLQNVNIDILSQILSDLKNDVKSGEKM